MAGVLTKYPADAVRYIGKTSNIMPEQSPYISLLYYILPTFILDSFELVNVEDKPVDNPTPELL